MFSHTEEPDLETANRLIRECWGLEARITVLPGYVDRNFRVDVERGPSYVLKVAPPGVESDWLAAERSVLQQLSGAALSFAVPAALPTRAGTPYAEFEHAGASRVARAFTWLPGVPLAELTSPPEALFVDLGRGLGALDRALEDFDHPGARRELRWDFRNASAGRRETESIAGRERRVLVETLLERFERHVRPRLVNAPCQVVHNDANDYNVLVDPAAPETVIGLLDFGDMVRTWRVSEIAVAMAYAALQERRPWPKAAAVLRGYESEVALSPPEREVLFDLIATRLALSVTYSAAAREQRPDDPYLSVSETHAWRVLDELESARDGLGSALADA